MLCRCGRTRDREDRVRCLSCREKEAARHRDLKAEVFAAYGGASCAYCSCDEFDALQIEHVFDDGAAERKAGLKGSRFYRHLKSTGFPQGRLLVSCANCNQIKQIKGLYALMQMRETAYDDSSSETAPSEEQGG